MASDTSLSVVHLECIVQVSLSHPKVPKKGRMKKSALRRAKVCAWMNKSWAAQTKPCPHFSALETSWCAHRKLSFHLNLYHLYCMDFS